MKNSRFAILFILFLFPNILFAQEKEEQQVRDIISFLEYMLNTLGDPATSARDKDVIVNESYAKVFRDSTVQVEDDLDENRDVITNKDVQAYLKDVEFFFKKAHFEFEWQGMEVSENEDGETYYKVELLRNLEAIGIMNDTINQSLKRYVEINLNPEEKDLRIVSIYTNELNQDDVWMEWWQNLSLEWQAIFKRKAGSIDDLEIAQIRQLENITELDLEGNRFIVDILPLSRITGLKHLNISHTQVSDISPIRNLNKLEFLDISHTGISSIASLRYARELKEFHIDQTPIQEIDVVGRMPALEILTMNGTFVTDLAPLAELKKLERLELAYTDWLSLAPLESLGALKVLDVSGTNLASPREVANLQSLRELYADSTDISTTESLSRLTNLEVLSANHTLISDLTPLATLPNLKRIYCDFTGITLAEARSFMAENTNVLIIFESQELIRWWDELAPEWKDIFRTYVPVSAQARKEELARVVRLDSLNIASNLYIQDVDPLQKLIGLEYLNARETAIANADPIRALDGLNYLDLSGTKLTDVTPLSELYKLKYLDISDTEVDSLGLVRILPNLDFINLDHTGVPDSAAVNMARIRPETLVLFKTDRLNEWWSSLEEDWKTIFAQQAGISGSPNGRELHELVSIQKIEISDEGIYDLHPLQEFIRLRELRLSGTRVRTLAPLRQLDALEVLDVSRNPLEDVQSIKGMKELRELNISNTPVEDLDILSSLYKLEHLDCSGTQIRRLDGLERLGMLNYLDCSNTSVKKLDPVEKLSLGTLKCYNTRISSKRIEGFKQLNPECDVSFY